MRAAATMLAFAFLGSVAVQAQDEDQVSKIDGLVRVIAAQAFIRAHCQRFYRLDEDLSKGLSLTAGEVLEKAVGKEDARVALQEEIQRIARDIDEVGNEQWCTDQRALLNTDGVKVFVD